MQEDITIVVDGETYAGKTTMLRRFIGEQFIQDTEVVYKPNEFRKEIEFNRIYKIRFIDLLGAKRYDHQRPQYYKIANSLIIIFDLTERLDYSRLESKIQLAENIGIGMEQIILVGNKVDLDQDNYIIYDKLTNFLMTSNINFYIETSAKTNININETFELAIIISLFSKGIFDENNFTRHLNKIKSQIKQIKTQLDNQIFIKMDLKTLLDTNEFKPNICPFCNSKIKLNIEICPNCKSILDKN